MANSIIMDGIKKGVKWYATFDWKDLCEAEDFRECKEEITLY